MLFSILIANYNNTRFLNTAIQSVLTQTYPNWEIIIVDDGSSDEFESIIPELQKNKRIRIYRNEKNEGCGYTKRRCAEHANGDILAFLDPDDALLPEALEIMVKAHEARPDCSIIHSTHYICDQDLKPKYVAFYPKDLPAGTPYLLVGDGSIHAFATFKSSCYKKTTGISPKNRRAVDQDLYYKLEETGGILFINEPLYYYRIHAGSISNSGQELAATLAHYAIIEEACKRRIKLLKQDNTQKSSKLIRLYRTRYYKIRVFHTFRKRKWLSFAANLAAFPFVGGMKNLVSYIRKLPKEGIGLIRKSFVRTYEIK